MHAMVLSAPGAPLRFELRDNPVPGAGEVRVTVSACAVCRTDLHVVDGELPYIAYPIVPGHEVVGRVDVLGPGVTARKIGERVGVPGSVPPAANVPTAGAAGRISATVPASPAIRATAALPRIWLPMRGSAFRSARPATTSPSRRCSAQG
jgi:NADPH:quinone reductase-like Zn-dependent oxidoreductase